MSTATTPTRRQLAERTANGLVVGLYWLPRSNRVLVTVDERGCEGLEFWVSPEHAHEAFEHPYMFAPGR